MSVPVIALEIDQGDDETLLIITTTPTDPDDPNSAREPANLSSCDLHWAVRTSGAKPPILTKATEDAGIVILNPPTDGKAKIGIAAADTAGLDAVYTGRTLKWELEVVDSTGSTTTLAKGAIVINRDLVST